MRANAKVNTCRHNRLRRVLAGLLPGLLAGLLLGIGLLAHLAPAEAQVAIRGKKVYTLAGPPIDNGVVVVREGKIVAVGPEAQIQIPVGLRVLRAEVVTPGLVDIRATVGLTGILNNRGHDQDQLEASAPLQPELRALDAYNPQEALVSYLRGFGVTTVNTGHAPGKVISGQTVIVKTAGNSVDAAMMVETGAIVADLSESGREPEKSPGTRAKVVSLLRQEFIKAREAMQAEAKEPKRDLRQEALIRLLKREVPLFVTAHRAQDIATALRLQKEFGFRLVLDGAAEAHQMLTEIKAAGVAVALHPVMARSFGDARSASFETPAKLKAAGIPFAIQSGFEDYVPKVRVVLFEAAIAAANGLSAEEALAAITITPARILGIDRRVGSLEVGKDGDVALFDGDPFEYTTHCVGVVINGQVVSSGPN